MPFCNQNGIRSPCCPFPTLKPIIPFWLQKGMKNVKFCINRFISWKYASRAFKIRSQNVYTTSGYDFMLIFVSAKNGQKRGGGPEKKSLTICGFWSFAPPPSMTIPWSFWNLLTPLPTTTPWNFIWKHLADTVKPKNIQVGRVHGSGRVNWRKVWFKFIWREKCYRYFFELFIELKVKFTEFSWGKAKPMSFRVIAFAS